MFVYMIPIILDAEGDSWTVFVDTDEIDGFATFESSIESIIFNIAGTNTAAGTYRVTITVDDGINQSSYQLEIEVITVNTAPYLVDWDSQSQVELTENQLPTEYTLPSIVDDEGDDVEVLVNLDMVSDFAFFDSDTNVITFDLIDSGVKPGYYTASIVLNDGRDLNTYNLIIKVNEAENNAPYFEDWESHMPILLQQGDYTEFTFLMPDTYDDDNDDVEISIDMGNIDHFAQWDSADAIVTFALTDDVEPGLHRATVTLDDGSLTTEYFLYVYVKAKEVEKSSDN